MTERLFKVELKRDADRWWDYPWSYTVYERRGSSWQRLKPPKDACTPWGARHGAKVILKRVLRNMSKKSVAVIYDVQIKGNSVKLKKRKPDQPDVPEDYDAWQLADSILEELND